MNSISCAYASGDHRPGKVVSALRWFMAVTGILVGALGFGQTAAAQAANQQIYRGTVTTNVELFDVYGQSKGVFIYQTAVDVILEPSLNVGGVQETNPFRFVIQSNPLVSAPGEISLYSSVPLENVMFQYWQFAMINDTTWQGVLANNHTEEAIALNLLTVPQEIAPHLEQPMPVAIANGTQMQGAVTGNQFTMILDGNSTGATTPFHIEIVAQRVQ